MPSSNPGAAEDTDGVSQVCPSSYEQSKWRAERSDGCADRSKCSS
jgi:thioester reductase-like protein